MTSEQPTDRSGDPPAEPSKERPPESLRRELWAICVLYLILSILPLLIGLGTGP